MHVEVYGRLIRRLNSLACLPSVSAYSLLQSLAQQYKHDVWSTSSWICAHYYESKIGARLAYLRKRGGVMLSKGLCSLCHKDQAQHSYMIRYNLERMKWIDRRRRMSNRITI
ncbi:hypothetical protein EMPS_07230 [Entomortierella parvispora]|uniref:Uncharacterized protein n=1 Tax=Entomortierella parvispora TaxID=205924 RepID=A0A9P3LY83_9FUNG|nr:hypothetical protein EMPS_07230 [Entomortierella parvispora]